MEFQVTLIHVLDEAFSWQVKPCVRFSYNLKRKRFSVLMLVIIKQGGCNRLSVCTCPHSWLLQINKYRRRDLTREATKAVPGYKKTIKMDEREILCHFVHPCPRAYASLVQPMYHLWETNVTEIILVTFCCFL